MTTNTSNFRRPLRHRRKGAIVVFAAFMLIVMVAMLALSIDVGYMSLNKGQVQRSVDAGALAGVSEMMVDIDNAENVAREYVQKNYVGGDSIPTGQIDVELGVWDSATRTFADTA